jgi:hypothetical protein
MKTKTILALCAAFALPGGAHAVTTKPLPEHFQPGGINGTYRGQYSFTATGTDSGYGTIVFPLRNVVYAIALTTVQAEEAPNQLYKLTGDGTLTILQTGLYTITANVDWPGQHGKDIDLRKILVQRVPVGTAPPVFGSNQLAKIPSDGTLYDSIAAHDTPGSDAPNYIRTSVQWAPGTIAVGKAVHVDVTIPSASQLSPTPGDAVMASHTGLTDATLGAGNAGLMISARVVAPNVVRVWLENRYGTGPITVGNGDLNLAVESMTTSTGNSSDGWTFLNSGPVLLLAGEKLMMTVRTGTPGDFMQVDAKSFLRIANVK